MLDQLYYQKADEIIAFYGKKPSSLIPVMQDIQGVYRYLPGELLTYIAKEIGVKEAKAYSVATFYENFSFEKKRKICDQGLRRNSLSCKKISGNPRCIYERTGTFR